MDTLPVTFLEAAACERPVVSALLPSYAGTFAERAFRMVPPGDVGELARALVEELEAPASARAAVLAEARRAVEREYDESIYARRLLEIYGSLAPAPAQRAPC
jgi:glycosyltransferase involved in cell wall biosynthesis